MLEIFDGSGAHLASMEVMKHWHERRILSFKEEGDSSHINQAYDKFVGKGDKCTTKESLAMLRNAKYLNKGVVDKWGLIHIGLFTVRATKRLTWMKSFETCNLNPMKIICFLYWRKKFMSIFKEASHLNHKQP